MAVIRNQSIEILEDVLSKNGYVFHTLSLGNSQRLYTQICREDDMPLLTLASGNPLYPFATSSARLITKDKLASYDFVLRNDVAIPKSVVVNKEDTHGMAFDLLTSYGVVIVKPTRESGAHGVTLDITTQDDLSLAIKKAHMFGSSAIVQRQFFGEEVRFIVADGKVVAALLREKPKVIGDGVSTIAKLIREENNKRAAITDTLVTYPQLDDMLISKTLVMSKDILPEGQRYELNKSTMIRGGASIFNIYDTIDKSYCKKAENAAQGLGRGFVVVDMMIKDATQPLTEENYVFIEFNLAPALSLFYSCRDGKHVPIVEDYLGPMLETCMSKGVLAHE